MTGRVPVPKRIRLMVAVAVSLVLVLTLVNLLLIVEGRPTVEPGLREGRTWTTGTNAPDREGTHTWSFQVDPRGTRHVRLDADLPYRMQVTHVEGRATLDSRVTYWVDGQAVHDRSHSVTAEPIGNDTVARTRTTSGDLGTRAALSIDRGRGAEPFVLVVTWDWTFRPETTDANVQVRTTILPVAVEPVDVAGLPACGTVCARVLVGFAFVAQVAAFFWHARAPHDPPPQESPPHRQAQVGSPPRRDGP